MLDFRHFEQHVFLAGAHQDPRLVLLDELKRQHFPGKIAVSMQRTMDSEEFEVLKARGADFVFLPYD